MFNLCRYMTFCSMEICNWSRWFVPFEVEAILRPQSLSHLLIRQKAAIPDSLWMPKVKKRQSRIDRHFVGVNHKASDIKIEKDQKFWFRLKDFGFCVLRVWKVYPQGFRSPSCQQHQFVTPRKSITLLHPNRATITLSYWMHTATAIVEGFSKTDITDSTKSINSWSIIPRIHCEVCDKRLTATKNEFPPKK